MTCITVAHAPPIRKMHPPHVGTRVFSSGLHNSHWYAPVQSCRRRSPSSFLLTLHPTRTLISTYSFPCQPCQLVECTRRLLTFISTSQTLGTVELTSLQSDDSVAIHSRSQGIVVPPTTPPRRVTSSSELHHRAAPVTRHYEIVLIR